MYSYLLPIGSVVKLKEAERLMMIFGVLQQNEKLEGRFLTILESHIRKAITLHLCILHLIIPISKISFTGGTPTKFETLFFPY